MLLSLQNDNILVTGATGFVGSHLVEKLLIYKPARLVCTNRSSDPLSYFNFAKLHKRVILADCDVKNYQRVFEILTKYEIRIIFHIAAQPLVTVAYQNPLETIETNIMGTANILEASRLKGDVAAIIVASSDKAYGKSNDLPYRETHCLQGDHPYDVSKTACDLIAQTYYRTYNLPVTISRFGNIFGAGDINFNRAIPGIFESIITNQEFLIRSDGEMVRQYVCVKDVVDGYILLAENIKNIRGQAFNFGSDNVYNIFELIERIEQALKKKVRYKVLDIAKNEIPKQFLDSQKAKQLIGWSNKIDFASAIVDAFAWYVDFYYKVKGQ